MKIEKTMRLKKNSKNVYFSLSVQALDQKKMHLNPEVRSK